MDMEAAPDGTALTLKELDSLIVDYVAKRTAYEAAKKISNDANALSEDAKFKVIKALEAANKTSYDVKGVAKITRTSRLMVRVPTDPAKKKEFFEYLTKRGMFETLATVNSASLNSFYNEEAETALENNIFPFSIPGIEEPTERVNIQMRKAKDNGKK